MFRRKLSVLFSAAALVVAVFAGFAGPAHAQSNVSISILLSSVGDLNAGKAQIQRFMNANPGITVQIVQPPQSATDELGLIQQDLAGKTGDIDIYQYDTIWPGILADNLVDLTQAIKDAKIDTSIYYPRLFNNDNVGGKQVGMPVFTDAGVLYYRTDLLKKYGYTNPPKTWDEMATMAAKIQAGERPTNPDFWG